MRSSLFFSFFFFNDTATTEIYTLSLHDALPICAPASERIEVPRLASPRKARRLTVTTEDASPVMGLHLKTSFLPLAITDQPHRSSLLGHSRVTALTGWTQLGRVYPCALLSLRVWQASCSLLCRSMARRAGTPLTNPLGNDKKQDLVNFLRAS